MPVAAIVFRFLVLFVVIERKASAGNFINVELKALTRPMYHWLLLDLSVEEVCGMLCVAPKCVDRCRNMGESDFLV